jgi:hypothetical protein
VLFPVLDYRITRGFLPGFRLCEFFPELKIVAADDCRDLGGLQPMVFGHRIHQFPQESLFLYADNWARGSHRDHPKVAK